MWDTAPGRNWGTMVKDGHVQILLIKRWRIQIQNLQGQWDFRNSASQATMLTLLLLPTSADSQVPVSPSFCRNVEELMWYLVLREENLIPDSDSKCCPQPVGKLMTGRQWVLVLLFVFTTTSGAGHGLCCSHTCSQHHCMSDWGINLCSEVAQYPLLAMGFCWESGDKLPSVSKRLWGCEKLSFFFSFSVLFSPTLCLFH